MCHQLFTCPNGEMHELPPPLARRIRQPRRHQWAALAQPAPAGQPGAARLRGTIDAVSDGALDMTVRGGGKVHAVLPATLHTTYVVAAKLSDIQPNSYIGTAAAPQPDGTLRALEVQVFPPSMRGIGEGTRPYDLQPGSTMTNGTVGSLVNTSGRVATRGQA